MEKETSTTSIEVLARSRSRQNMAIYTLGFSNTIPETYPSIIFVFSVRCEFLYWYGTVLPTRNFVFSVAIGKRSENEPKRSNPHGAQIRVTASLWNGIKKNCRIKKTQSIRNTP